MARSPFTRAELALVAGAAFLVFSRVFAFSLVLPGFREHGATLTDSRLLVGLALGAYGVTMALAQLANGWLSDHWGRRPVLLAGSAVFVAGSVWAALADSIGALLAARLLQGLGGISSVAMAAVGETVPEERRTSAMALGGISSVAMAAVGETVPEERRTSAMALVGVPAGLGFFLGFVLGPLGEDAVGFRGLFWATAVLGLLAALPLAIRGLPPPRPMPPATQPRPGFPVAALAAAGFAVNLAMTAVAYFLPALRDMALAAILLGALVVMGVASRVLDRSGLVAWPVAGLLVALAGGACVFLTGAGLAWTAVGGLAFFAAHATLSAVLPSQVSRLAGRSGGRGHGVQLVVAYLGSAAGGALAGGLDEAASRGAGLAGLGPVAATCLGLGVVALAAAALALAALPRSSRPSGPGPSTGPRAAP